MIDNVSLYKAVFTSLLIAFIWFILTPILIHYTWLFWRSSRDCAIQKREPILILSFNVACVTYLLLDQTFSAMMYGYDWNDNQFAILKLLEHAVYPSLHLFTFSMVVRLYFLMYNIRWTKSSINEQWKQHLLFTDDSTHHSNWILRHKSTYGNPKWVSIRFFIPWAIFIELGLVWFNEFYFAYHSLTLYFALDLILFLIDICAIATLTYLVPQFADHFRIREELIIIVKSASGTLLIYVVYSIAILFGSPFYPTHAASILIFSFSFAEIALVTTYWLLNRSGVMSKDSNRSYSALSQHMRMQPANSDGDQHSPRAKRINVTHVLAHKEAFQLFMGHLFREFSSENLLAVVEFSQFQTYAVSLLDEKEGTPEDTMDSFPDIPKRRPGLEIARSHSKNVSTAKYDTVTLYKGIPKSAIVYNEQLSVPQKAIALMDKYVCRGATFELNLCSEARNTLLSLREHLYSVASDNTDDNRVSDRTLAKCFGRVIHDVLRLMTDSFMRWKHTDDYANLQEVISTPSEP